MYRISGNVEKPCENTASIPNPSNLFALSSKLGVGI